MDENTIVECPHCRGQLKHKNYIEHLHKKCQVVSCTKQLSVRNRLLAAPPVKIIKKREASSLPKKAKTKKCPPALKTHKHTKPVLPTQCSYCKAIIPMDSISEHRKNCDAKLKQSNGKKSRSGAKSNRLSSYNNHRYYESFYSSREDYEK